MAPTIVNVTPEPTLLRSFLRLSGVRIRDILDHMGEGTICRSALEEMVRGQRVPRPATLVVVREALNVVLLARGERPLSVAGLRHLTAIAPSPIESDAQMREIRRAQQMR
jgi:hypothetical protein